MGEARSEPIEGIVAVGCVIRNRVNADLNGDRKPDWWGEGYRGVCLAPYQFSTWHSFPGSDEMDRNYAQVLDIARRLARGEEGSAVFKECAWTAEGIFSNALRDRVSSCTHYHAAKMQPRPAWGQERVPRVQVGSHLFYSGTG